MSRVFQVKPPGWSSAVWTCPRWSVARKDTRRVTVCTSTPVFLSEWRWLIKIRAPSLASSPHHSHKHAHTPVNSFSSHLSLSLSVSSSFSIYLFAYLSLWIKSTHTGARPAATEREEGTCLNVYLAAKNTLASHVRTEIMSSKESIVS